MNVKEALDYIHSISWKGSIPGLGRIETLLSRMGNPHHELKFIHIAGTNGKGSTAAMLAATLQTAGYRTGLYTSPYLARFHERMQVDGQEISDDDLSTITAFVRSHALTMDNHPTEFELVCAIAFEYFKRKSCEIVVLEVGMGGELDATNVIAPPEVAVICNIGLDHMNYLGDTIEKIAKTKAGIIKKGCPVVLYDAPPSVAWVIAERCSAMGATLHRADFSDLEPVSHSLAGQEFHYGRFRHVKLPLLGVHQQYNCAVVIKTLMILQEIGYAISDDAIYLGLSKVTWAGRFEVLRHDPLFLVDGGHNPQCIEALVENIKAYLPNVKLTVLTGVLADKDFSAMYDDIAPFVKEFITVTPDSSRAMSAADLQTHLSKFGMPVTACDSVSQGVHTAIAAAKKDGVVLAYGSLYMVGDIRTAVMEVI